jgi:hypothetical protein
MGTLIVIFITLVVIANGVLLTFLAIDRITLTARLCAGSVIGLAALSWSAFLVSLAIGLNATSIALTLLFQVIALIALLRLISLNRVRDELGSIGLSKTGVIYYAAWAALLAWLFGRVMMFYPDGMHTAPANNYGDLPFHLSVVTSFAYGENLPPQNPIFAGMKFTYPFLIDFLTAFFIRCGADWRTAFFVGNFVLSLSLVGLIDSMTLRLTGNKLAARLAPLIFLFNGGLGFINFFRDLAGFWNDPSQLKTGLVTFLAHLPKTYTMNTDLILSSSPSGTIPLRWGNVFTTLLIPQRSMLFGLPIAAMIITLWWMAVGESGRAGERGSGRAGERGSGRAGERESERAGERESGRAGEREKMRESKTKRGRNMKTRAKFPHSPTLPLSPSLALPLSPSPALLLSAGILAGILPMLHTHGFFAVMIASVLAVLLFPSRKWIAFYAPVIALAGPQVWWLKATPVRDSLFKFELWREAGGSSLFAFWGANNGIFLALLIAAMLTYRSVEPRLKRFYLPFLLWFLVPNLLSLAPWPWDNIKVLIYWSLASCPLVAVMLAYLFTRRFAVLPAALIFIALTLAGALDVLRALSPAENTRLFDKEALEVASILREKTPPRSVMLHAPIHNSVVALSGRQSVMGYPGHLWTHGIDYRQREAKVLSVYRGGQNEFLSRFKVDYVIIGPVERSQLLADENYFASRYPLAIDHGEYRVYQVNK